jgi:hypothetical protein
MDTVQEKTDVKETAPSISVLRANDTQGHPCVAVILSQNAFVETNDTHEPYPGIALNPEAARLVIAKIQAVLREIAAGSETVIGFFKLTYQKTEEPKKD